MNVLVTGGASGLGAHITRKLANESSMNVYFTYNKSEDEANEIVKTYKNTYAIKCNFTNKYELEKLYNQIPTINPNVLINNALVSVTKKHFHKMDQESIVQSFQYNVMPVLMITQHVIKVFRRNKFGKIITILSSAIINKPPLGWSEYVANKAYLHSISKAWANENASYNITSNCISPSFMETELNKDIDNRIVDLIISSHPLNKILKPSEVADVAYFLVQASQQVNGVNFIINAAENVV